MTRLTFLSNLKVCSLFLLLVLLWSCAHEPDVRKFSGFVFGTSYSVQFYSDKHIDYESKFDSIFYVINRSMSTYQPNSIISRINRNENVLVDTHFLKVLEAAQEIYLDTEGVFDPTIGVLVNAWDFGPEGKVEDLDSLKIDSLMRFVGFNRVTRINRSIFKPKATFLDFNAIAKGYAVDVIAEYLETEDIVNYLVEIGGELLAKGINIDKSDDWKVGVEMPHFDGDQSILKAIRLKDESMATSGTYRKFKTDNLGNRYAHIINAETGYPSKTNILSVSVIADKCMVADAYATAFQAMDIERIKSVLSGHPELKVFLIFENKLKELETISLNDFPDGQ